MIAYSSLSFVTFFGAALLVTYMSSRVSRRIQCMVAIIITVSISLFYGLRGFSVGVDTVEYISRLGSGLIKEDYLFSSIGLFTNAIGLSPSAYLFLISLLTSVFLALAIRNFTGSYAKASFFLVLIAILPYGIMSYVNIIRQGLAVAIILFGISLIYRKRVRTGYFVNILSFFIHRTTALVYLGSIIVARLRKYRYGILLIVLLTVTLMVLSSLLPHLISLIDPSIGNRYADYSGYDSSESPYLIYAKIAWALLHLKILSQLNKSEQLFKPLYMYYASIVITALILISNTLVSSRVLSSIDFILPVVYASYQGKNKRLRNVGIALILLYALASPFIFQMYSVSFG